MKATEILQSIKNNKINFSLIYGKENAESEKERYFRLVENFIKKFGDEEANIFSASGRTEICGNHTDHQHGKCLAGAVNLDTICIAKKNSENVVRIFSSKFNSIEFSLENVKNFQPKESEYGESSALCKGIIKGFTDKGYNVCGFDAITDSEVEPGAGISSSASFENVIGTAINCLFCKGEVDALELAKISQVAENKFFGKPCGLLDQTASAVGGITYMDFSDPSSPIVEKIDVDLEKFGLSLCIVDTKGSHSGLTKDYAEIISDMKKVAEYFGKEFLKDVDEKEFYGKLWEIRGEVGDRPILRAQHFFNEEHNVENAVKALKNSDGKEFCDLINKSGNSSYKYLQNLYSLNNYKNQELCVGISVSERLLKGTGAVRVHGGGFAGTIQAFIKKEDLPYYKKEIEKIFGENSCRIMYVRPVGAIKVI